MFNSAQLDRKLLESLDQLQRAGVIEIGCLSTAANDSQAAALDVEQLLRDAAHAKLEYLINVATADVDDLNHPMVRVERWTDSTGFQCMRISTIGDKIKALGQLIRLSGGMAGDSDAACY